MNGRKRVLLVDTEGLVQAIWVVPASVQDRDTPAVLELARSSLLKVWADLAFSGEAAASPMTRCGIDLELVGRKGKVGFAVESWLGHEEGTMARHRTYPIAINDPPKGRGIRRRRGKPFSGMR